MRRISSPGAAAPQATQAAPPPPPPAQGGGWGETPAPQRGEVQSKISGGAPAPQQPNAGWGDQGTGQQISTGGERVDAAQTEAAPTSKPRTRRASNKAAEAPAAQETVSARVQPEGDIARIYTPDLELTDYKVTFDIAAFLAAWTSAGADYDEGVEEAFKIVERLRGKPF